jgi:hypothetical protein
MDLLEVKAGMAGIVAKAPVAFSSRVLDVLW